MLTDAQKVDVRRWAGYQLQGDGESQPFTVPVFTSTTVGGSGVMPGMTLDYRLDHMSVSEETVLVDTFLTPLAGLETAILGAAANLDTDQAAVWKRNPREVADRNSLFNQWRRRMCGFIGIAPGPELGEGGMTLVRA
jgi:hypothetical protein